MRASSLVIVADRGSLKAYRVNEAPERGPSLKLVQALEINDGNQFVDSLGEGATVVAQVVPAMERSGGHHMKPVTDWPQMEAEAGRRICRQLANQIARIVKDENIEGWSFAAPASIHAAIVGFLPLEIRERIVEHVKSDLVKTDSAKLPAHFPSLQPI